MNLDHLRYFVRLAQVGHYTRASEQLNISQPSLSHAVRQLEEELGVPLFERQGRNTQLTQFGAEFLDCAARTLATLDEGVTSLRRKARGEGLIRLGFLRVLGTEYVPRLAARFLAAHPDRQIQFTFHSGRTQELLEGLADRRYDLVFCSRPAPELGLTAVPVRAQELVLIVPTGHPLAGRSGVSLAEAAPYPMVCFSRDSGLRAVVDELFAALGVCPQVAWETEEDQVVAGLVAQGFGIAVVPEMDVLRQLDLVALPITAPPYRRDFFLVHDDRLFLSPAAREFRQFVLSGGDGCPGPKTRSMSGPKTSIST